MAYQENAVPAGDNAPAYPYLTYEVATSAWGDVIPLTVNLWYRSTSWVAANAMAQHIADEISSGGIQIPCDNGTIWIQRGTPFARSASDGADSMIRRKILNVIATYNTED